MQSVVTAMAQQQRDPFQGTRERRVIDPATRVVEMEVAAATEALTKANVSADQIDLVLTCTAPMDYALTNSACELHEKLGLARDCFTLQIEGAQHAFLLQLALAETMVLAGRARYGLLVQSSAVSRLVDPTSPASAVFGDGATAVVVGLTPEPFGILASAHRTDGRFPNTLIASVPGDRWYADGRATLHFADPVGMRDILLRTVDVSVESIGAALAKAGLAATDVDVFCMHQGMPWLRQLVQQSCGLGHARAVDTFQVTGHMFGAFLPSTLYAAERDGVLRRGDMVVLAGGGNGMTYGATVLRWGR